MSDKNIKGIEGLRILCILCETTFENAPDVTIEAWARDAVRQHDEAQEQIQHLQAEVERLGKRTQEYAEQCAMLNKEMVEQTNNANTAERRVEELKRERDEYSQVAGVALDAVGYPLQKRIRFDVKEYRAHLAKRSTEQQIKALEWVLSSLQLDGFSSYWIYSQIEQLRAGNGGGE